MNGTLGVVVAAGAIACLAAAEGSAHAGDDEDAIIKRALELRKQGNDRVALEELQRAYSISHSPRAAAQLGFAEQALGMWPQAEEHVQEAVSARTDRWIRKNRATLEASLATIRAHVGRVHVDGGEVGAQVTVNGRSVGALPLRDAIAVSAGPVDIEVRAAGYLPALKTVNVAAGESARVPFTLQPLSRGAAPPPARPPVALAPVTPPPPPGPTLAAPPAPEETARDAGRGRRIAGVSLIAGGVAVIGAGVAASVVAKNKFDAIRSDAAADRPYDEANGNWKTYETAATIAYVIGGGALAGGLALYVAGRSSAESGRPPAVQSVSLRPTYRGAPGASLSLRF
jgi:hypothetical protein